MLLFPTMTKIEMLYFASLLPFLGYCLAKPFNQMDGEVDEYRFSPYDALNQFRDEQYERNLPVPADLAPPPGLAWNFNVENIPVEPDAGYEPLPSIQRRHLKNLMRRFVDREADADFGLPERFYKKGGPGRNGQWSPFELQGAPTATKTKKPQHNIIKSIPRNFCDDRLSKINRILIKEHQIQLQFQKSKGENIDVTFDSPVIVQQDQISVADQQNDEPQSLGQQIINADELNQEPPKTVQPVKPEEEQYKPENKPEPDNPRGKQNKQETLSENRPALISDDVRDNIPQTKPKITLQNKPETASQNRPQAPTRNKMENIPEPAEQNKPEQVSEEKPETAQQIKPDKPETAPQRKPGRIYEEKPEMKTEPKPQQPKQAVPPARPNPVPKNVEEDPEAGTQQQKPSRDWKSNRVPKVGKGQTDDTPQFFHFLRNQDGNNEQKTQNDNNFEEADRHNPRAEEDTLTEAVKNIVNRRLQMY